tara:strand:- start:1890 stop:2816 length:927 start_codon:yes stop_codon:yes gene_type:complete
MHLKKNTKFFPIILFAYNRPIHTKKVLNQLKKNKFANRSELYVFCDGPKNKKDVYKILKIKKFIQNLNGFKKVQCFFHPKNVGLKKSILFGTNKIFKNYEAAIILEDDIYTSNNFLIFMNQSLHQFKNNHKVWHINGWCLPLKNESKNKTFFYRTMHCWGWGTWANKWKYYSDNIKSIEKKMNKEKIFYFNNDGTENFYWQLLANKKKYTTTWSIFWYLTIFINKGLCLSPSISLTRNIGLDGSGVHSKKTNNPSTNLKLNNSLYFMYPKKVVEDKLMFKKISDYYKSSNSIRKRLFNKVYYFFKVFW